MDLAGCAGDSTRCNGRRSSTPFFGSNETAAGGRLVLLAFDLDGIKTGGGRDVAMAAGKFVDGLAASDQVGLVSLPSGPSVEFTPDRAPIHDALESHRRPGHPCRSADPCGRPVRSLRHQQRKQLCAQTRRRTRVRRDDTAVQPAERSRAGCVAVPARSRAGSTRDRAALSAAQPDDDARGGIAAGVARQHRRAEDHRVRVEWRPGSLRGHRHVGPLAICRGGARHCLRAAPRWRDVHDRRRNLAAVALRARGSRHQPARPGVDRRLDPRRGVLVHWRRHQRLRSHREGDGGLLPAERRIRSRRSRRTASQDQGLARPPWTHRSRATRVRGR